MVVRLMTGCLAITLLTLALACSRDSTRSPVSPSPAGSLNVGDIAASASTADTSGERRAGLAPAAGGGPRITASGNRTVINGGTLSVAIAGDSPFNVVYVFIGGKTLGLLGEFPGAIDGYYELRLPSARTAANVVLTFPQEIPLDEFDLQFAVASPSGVVGPYTSLTTTVTRVGTGDVQVTLSWDADSDVDLHVVAPGGEEIYYASRQSASGGQLDLDSNAGCAIDGVRNENITWPVGRAPRGQYTVRVDYWSSCGVTRSNYTVRVNNGGSVQVVEGFFTGSGDQGGAGSGRTVATFERSSGPTAAVVTQTLTPESAWYLSKKLVTSQIQRR
jgi:uncharacterized protein YfaP (DUF2135 family)